MAVVSVTTTDTGVPTLFSLPAGGIRDTAVPRGIHTFEGTQAIAAKIAANQTQFQLTLNFTDAYIYMLKTGSLTMISDDQVLDFGDTGIMFYSSTQVDNSLWPHVNITSPGVSFSGAALVAVKTWERDWGTPCFAFDGETDDVRVAVADTSSDASSAGDIRWRYEFYIFDKDQYRNYPVHTPTPVRVC